MKTYHPGKHVIDTAHRLKLYLDSTFVRHDLSGMQARILGFVDICNRQGKSVYQKDIETEFRIRRSSVTSVLNTMEKNGYILRRTAHSDARLKEIILTEKAIRINDERHGLINAFESSLLAGMSQEDISKLNSLLNKINENLERLKGC
ncbi:MAG: MarR family transcriptional regulator [Oscillospiraceae bacterium]|nr:MarR family transcriptional regulator [Oscillospiraceae bacterium]